MQHVAHILFRINAEQNMALATQNQCPANRCDSPFGQRQSNINRNACLANPAFATRLLLKTTCYNLSNYLAAPVSTVFGNIICHRTHIGET